MNIKMMVGVLLLIAASTASANAQTAMVVFHPGETVHIVVTLKDGPSPQGCTLAFGLVSQPEENQQQLEKNFQVSNFRQVDKNQIEITGTIPEHAASGTFRLAWMSMSFNGIMKEYDENRDFEPVTLKIVNPEEPEFPVIQSVKVAP